MRFQSSPVELLNNVKKLTRKDEKLQLSVTPTEWRFTKGNRFIPVTAKINRIIPRSPPILAKSGRVMMNVWNIILKDFAFLISLSTLTILNDLSTEVAVPKLFSTPVYSRTTPTTVKITTVKSNRFHPYLK